MVRKQVRYAGRVQGVGFRATTVRIAQRFVVVGTVQNLDDGTVQMEVQGQAKEVTTFLAAVERELGRHIRTAHAVDVTIDTKPIDPQAPDTFRVVY